MATRIYLDHAAATPLLPEARAAMLEGHARWANPSSPHAEGRAARAALEEARREVARAYGWEGALLFTGGTSEALAIALGRAQRARRLVLATEHEAVFRAAGAHEVLPVDAGGQVRWDALAAALAAGPPPLVAAQWANSETGVRQPIAALGEAVHAAGGLLLVDAAQMPAGADPAVAAHADFVALSSHKRGGPPGIAALFVRDLAMLAPSGGQEQGFRAGTENLPAALGFAAALKIPKSISDFSGLRASLESELEMHGGIVVGREQVRHPAIGAYRLPGAAAAAQLIRLDLAGIAVSAGSACSSGSLRPSHVLTAMGWPEAAAREVIRVSFGRSTSEDEIRRFANAWSAIARETKARAA